MLAGSLVVAAPAPHALAAGNPWPHRAMGGFSTPKGQGFWITYADGGVTPVGTAHDFGNSSSLRLVGPMQGGASTPKGDGYWLVGWDGGIFTHGGAHFYGSMGGHVLNQPVFSMTPTRRDAATGWSRATAASSRSATRTSTAPAGHLPLNQPVTGITRSPSGRGYRMVAADGGIFSFGDAPVLRKHAGQGHSRLRRRRHGTHARQQGLLDRAPRRLDVRIRQRALLRQLHHVHVRPVTGIFSNPTAPGYRLVTENGATIPFGAAPGGSSVTGSPRPCATQLSCVPSLKTAADYQNVAATHAGPVWDGGDGAAVVDLGNSRRLWLFGDTYSGPTDANVRASRVQPFYATPSPSSTAGAWSSGSAGSPARSTTTFPDPAPADWYWPMDGVVDAANNVVQLSALHVDRVEAATAGYRWRVVRTEILTLDLRSLAFRSATPLPTGTGLQWGSSMIDVGGTIYIYAHNLSDQYVARTTMAHLTDGQWSYWTGSSWSTNSSAARPMSVPRPRLENPTTRPRPPRRSNNTAAAFSRRPNAATSIATT